MEVHFIRIQMPAALKSMRCVMPKNAILPDLKRFVAGILPVLWMLFPSPAGCLWSADAVEPATRAVRGVRSAVFSISPVVPAGSREDRRILNVDIDSDGLTDSEIRLLSRSWPSPMVRASVTLPPGRQRLSFDVPEWPGPSEAVVRITTADTVQSLGPFPLPAPRRWTVHLVQHTHTDIGYTRPQTEILPEHLRYIDTALDYCDLTDGYGDDSRFRWTCETSWAVREYFRTRPAGQIARLKKRIAEGRIEVTGLMLNMSDIAGEAALAASLRPLAEMEDGYGVTVRTAMQNDVNGAGWCLPDFFGGIGIRYLIMGINQTRSLLPFDKPTCFWWESPSGGRVLAYRADHYMTANFWGIEKGDSDKFRSEVESYLTSLERRHYPFDRVAVQFSGYFTDNSPPSTAACDLVRDWNLRYAWPRLRLSTSQEFPGWVEKEHGPGLPVLRQAWPDWWTDGAGSAARETAAVREAQSVMQSVDGLLAIASMLGAGIRRQTLEREAAIQDELLFYDEHTYGAAESISDPLAENSQVQWSEKASYAWNAVKRAALLAEEAFGLLQDFLPRSAVPSLAVFNTLNWERSGAVRVYIDHQMLPPGRGFRISDGGRPVPAQAMETRTDGTYWAVWVSDVPPMGCKVLRIESGEKPAAGTESAGDSLFLENEYYRLRMDPLRGGISSLVDRESGAELVDAASPWALGQCIYETMPGDREMKPEVFKRNSLHDVRVTPGESGPVWKSLRLTGELDGCAAPGGLRMEARLYENEKRVDLNFSMRKLAVPTPESVYAAFPFLWPDARLAVEAQGGSYAPGEGQIPGSSSDWQAFQSYVSLRNRTGQIILGSDRIPLVQLGDFNCGRWQPVTRVARPHVFSWVMNNYWITNFCAEQEGEFRWSYYLTSTADTGLTAAARFGWGSRIPLPARVLAPEKKGPTRDVHPFACLRMDAPNLLLVESRPSRDCGGVILHLRETAGKEARLSFRELESSGRIRRMDEVNVLEQPLRKGVRSIEFGPFEARFVRIALR